jgi:hypothetical protein
MVQLNEQDLKKNKKKKQVAASSTYYEKIKTLYPCEIWVSYTHVF